ncbi:MAG: hypothetical protein J7J44_04090 [Deltaproteobacteria bacterium]|nr:hypothetical protein [Deltaproteobacteria bacterium]
MIKKPFPNFTGKPGDIDLIVWNENLSDYYIVPQVEDLEKAVYRIIGAKKILKRIEKEKIPVGYTVVPWKDTKDKLPEERGSFGLQLPYRPAPKIKINEDLKQKREKLVEFIKNQKL